MTDEKMILSAIQHSCANVFNLLLWPFILWLLVCNGAVIASPSLRWPSKMDWRSRNINWAKTYTLGNVLVNTSPLKVCLTPLTKRESFRKAEGTAHSWGPGPFIPLLRFKLGFVVVVVFVVVFVFVLRQDFSVQLWQPWLGWAFDSETHLDS